MLWLVVAQVFTLMLDEPVSPRTLVERHGLAQVSDSGAIGEAVDAVLAANAVQVQQLREGNEKVFGFLVGETMRRMKGKGNPRLVNELLRKKLGRT